MIKLQLGEGYLDTFKGLEDTFFVTKQIADLRTLKNRKGDFSRDISLPRTKNNEELLDIEDNIRLGNPAFNCALTVDGILITGLAKLIVVEYTQDTVRCVLVSGNFELFDYIPDRSIRDLDFSEYNFPFSEAGFAGLGATTEGAVVSRHYWIDESDILDNGSVPDIDGNVELKQCGIDFFMKTIARKIVENVGYTWVDAEIDADDNYNNLVISCPLNAFQQEDVATGPRAEWSLTNDFVHTATVDGQRVAVQWNQQIEDADGIYDGGTFSFIVPSNGEYTVTCNYYCQFTATGPGEGGIEMQLDGAVIDSAIFLINGNPTGQLQARQNFIAGQLVRIMVYGSYQNQNNFDIVTVKSTSSFIIDSAVEDIQGDVQIADWLPDIKQKEFLRSFLSMLNIQIQGNPYQKNANLRFFDDISIQQAQDFSKHVDKRQDINNQISLPYYKESVLSMAEDNLNRTDSNYTVLFNRDESLAAYGTILDLPFCNSDLSQYNASGANQTNALYSPFYQWSQNYQPLSVTINAGSDTFAFNKDVDWKPGDYLLFNGKRTLIRIKQRTGLRTGIMWATYTAGDLISDSDCTIVKVSYQDLSPRTGLLIDEGSAITVEANRIQTITGTNIPCKTFTSWNMSNTYQYYAKLFSALQTPFITQIWMNFSASDFADIDFLKPVTIDGMQGSFFINKIEQYKLNTPCRVELIRLNDLVAVPETFNKMTDGGYI
jgi:plastocyanin